MGRMRFNLVGNRKRGGFVLSLVFGALLISSSLVVLSGCTTELIDTINKMVDFYNRTDKAALEVLATYPEHGETGVYRDTKITVNFAETMDDETINDSSFTLSDGLQNVKGTVTYVEAFNMAVFAPASTMFESNRYFPTLTRDIRDLIGNRLEGGKEWFFNTGTGLDPADPYVIIDSELPERDEPEAVLNTKISMEFSEPLDPTTINASTIQISPNPDVAGLSESSGSFSYDNTNFIVVYTPGTKLQFGTTYTVTVTSGVKDLAGRPLNPEYEWSFTAGAEPDFNPPILVDFHPRDLDIDVGIDSNAVPDIYIQFDEPINPPTLNTQTFSLRKNGQLVTGKVQYDADLLRAVYVLLPEASAKLSFITQYTITIAGTVEDMSGNQLGSSKHWTFVTVASDSTVGPNGISVDIVDVGLAEKMGLLTAYIDVANENGDFLSGITNLHFMDFRERVGSGLVLWEPIKTGSLGVEKINPRYKSIVLVIDLTRNMDRYWDGYLEILNDFIKSLDEELDQVKIVTFGSEKEGLSAAKPFPEVGFTPKKEMILEYIYSLKPNPDAAYAYLYDAIEMGIHALVTEQEPDPTRGLNAVVSLSCVDPPENLLPLGSNLASIIGYWNDPKVRVPTYSIVLPRANEVADLVTLGTDTSGFYAAPGDFDELRYAYLSAIEHMHKFFMGPLYAVTWETEGRAGEDVDVQATIRYETESEGWSEDTGQFLDYKIPKL